MSKTTSPIRVLVVDDEIDHADVIAEAIARMGYAVKTAHNLADAQRDYINAESDTAPAAGTVGGATPGGFDLVITDLKMDSPTDGFELLKFIREASAKSPAPNRVPTEVIVITAHGDVSIAVQAMRQGAYDFIQKPLDLDIIRTQVKRAADKILLAKKNLDLSHALDQKFGLHGIIGNSAPMQRVLQLIRQFAPTDISCLILGESGTGKELVARALHQNSRRAANRFVALNCAGLNESTLEDELFGHVRGAFTDARGDREGRFEYADQGTLFLDEIGDMPLAMQAKLLRVLQDKQITRLGSNEPIQVDVRFISATNKDLEAAVRDRSFREDLYFRIKGATILLPPLRNRRDDIPLLINFIMHRAAEKLAKKIDGIDAEARNALVAYHWPGNVRQLENIIENMVVLATTPKLSAADLPPEIAPHASSPPSVDPTPHAAPSTQHSTALTTLPAHTTALTTLAGVNLAELEKKAIEETLASVHGNREQAAQILGIGERTLYRKIKEYGLKE